MSTGSPMKKKEKQITTVSSQIIMSVCDVPWRTERRGITNPLAGQSLISMTIALVDVCYTWFQLVYNS